MAFGSQIRTIQRATGIEADAISANAENTENLTLGTTLTDLTKAQINYVHVACKEANAADLSFAAYLTSTTNLRVYLNTIAAIDANTIRITYEIIEYY